MLWIHFFLENLSSSARRVHDEACRPGYDEASHDGHALCQVQHARKKWQSLSRNNVCASS